MKNRICVSIFVKKRVEIVKLINRVEERGASLIEFRFDHSKNKFDLEKIYSITSLPKIATVRRHDEGGFYRGSEKERTALLLNAAETGFEYIDIELTTADLSEKILDIKERGSKVIVSKHILTNTPSNKILERILNAQIKAGADICKIITRAKKWEDNLTILNLLSKKKDKVNLICFALGKFGTPSRVLTTTLGGFCTYTAVQSGFETAEGQISIDELKRVQRIIGIETD